ncbi:MAG: 2,3-diphosphoglycerate-dependent phosphoglycerate mutase GpmB [Chloroflexota bacterium]
MTAVYVFRHPETTWNAVSRYQGRLDAPLSVEGQRQAHLVTSTFSSGDFSVIYSSPMQRAAHLAIELADATAAKICYDERLTEVGQGCWEGLQVAEIEAHYPELYALWYRRPDLVRFPGGETLREVRVRGNSVLTDIFDRHPSANVGLVTHSVVVQVLVAEALALDLRFIHNIHIANAGITTICGSQAPGSILSLNMTEPLYGSPIVSASAQNCISWKARGTHS